MLAYNREKAVEYAKKWALERNPAYYNFDGIGGGAQISLRSAYLQAQEL